jgi:hypothetical protein
MERVILLQSVPIKVAHPVEIVLLGNYKNNNYRCPKSHRVQTLECSNVQMFFKLFFRFGVCCLFIVTEAGGTVSENCSYIQNPSFPAVYAETTSLKYTINKCASGIFIANLFF